MWWEAVLWRLWNGPTAWIVLTAQVCGLRKQVAFKVWHRGGRYELVPLLGAGMPPLGAFDSLDPVTNRDGRVS
jgi:hypothetical protein